MGEIVRLLLEKKLADISVVPQNQGIPLIYVSPDEVLSHLVLPEPEGLSENEVAKILHVSVQAVRSLQKAGHLFQISTRDPRTRKAIKRFMPRSVAAFDQKYASQSFLAERYQIPPHCVVGYFASLDCAPTLKVAKAAPLFNRVAVEEAEARTGHAEHQAS